MPLSSKAQLEALVRQGRLPSTDPAVADAMWLNNRLLAFSTPVPVVVTHPGNATVIAGNTATFTSEFSGATSYQWQSNTGSGWSNISGATSTSYTTGTLSTGNSGTQYRCVGTNVSGSTNTNAATLTVNPPAPTVTTHPENTTAAEGATATFTVVIANATSYQWQSNTGSGWSNISGAVSASYTTGTLSAANTGTQYRCTGTNVTGSVTTNAATLTVSVTPPAAITEYWVAGQGMFQDSGMTQPVTAAGQTVARWVGVKSSTVLTCTNTIAQSVGGVLVPKCNTGNMQLPGSFATSRQDLTVVMHVQRPGTHQTRALFGLGSARSCELMNFNEIRLLSSDGATNVNYALNPKVSPCTITMRSNASARLVGVNGTEVTGTAFGAASNTGGRFFSFHDGTQSGSDRVWGIAIGPRLSDSDLTISLNWANFVKTRPLESSPTLNIVVFGDSQAEGLNAGGRSWMVDLIDDTGARGIPVVGSATYFNAGGAPQNSANNLARVTADFRSGARNIIIISTTNDFDQGTSAGTDYFNAVKTQGLTWLAAGWEVWVVRQPYRTAPYGSATTFNAQVDVFNGLLTSDPWMTGTINFASALNGVSGALNADGIHWSSTGQGLVLAAVKSALGV